MPVMLDQDTEEAWLSPDTPTEEAFALLAPYERTTTLAVSGAVNDARYDGPECLTPAPPPPETLF
jgi:putative SOS response-associated peptidase YedK